VVAATLTALSQLGARPQDLIVALGPMIERCCFEVGEDVAQTLAEAGGTDEVVDRSFARPHIDLRRVIEAQLSRHGVTEIDHVRGCTKCDEPRFHSYRRDGKRGGRMLSAVVPGSRSRKVHGMQGLPRIGSGPPV
jgi:copper oxidase (laccase) domain-containing protein